MLQLLFFLSHLFQSFAAGRFRYVFVHSLLKHCFTDLFIYDYSSFYYLFLDRLFNNSNSLPRLCHVLFIFEGLRDTFHISILHSKPSNLIKIDQYYKYHTQQHFESFSASWFNICIKSPLFADWSFCLFLYIFKSKFLAIS